MIRVPWTIFIASAQCTTAVQSLHVPGEASRHGSDRNSLILHVACKALSHAPTDTASVVHDIRVQYGIQKAQAHLLSIASELHQHFVPLKQHEANVDLLSGKAIACLTSAAINTLPQACKQGGECWCRQQVWFNGTSRGISEKGSCLQNPLSTALQKRCLTLCLTGSRKKLRLSLQE